MIMFHRRCNNFVGLQVLTEPKNALGKQYKKMYQMNSVTTSLSLSLSPSLSPPSTPNLEQSPSLRPQVKLHFTESALQLIARKAITKNTGARGLRALLESILMDSMYEVNTPLITYKPMLRKSAFRLLYIYTQLFFFFCQIPDESTGNDMIEAVVVDEEAVEGEGRRGSGAKILRGKGALSRYLSETKSKDSPQVTGFS